MRCAEQGGLPVSYTQLFQGQLVQLVLLGGKLLLLLGKDKVLLFQIFAVAVFRFFLQLQPMLFEIAKRHGLDLEEEAEYGNRKYLEKQDFILAKPKEPVSYTHLI